MRTNGHFPPLERTLENAGGCRFRVCWLWIGILTGLGAVHANAANVSITVHNKSPTWRLTAQWYYTPDPSRSPLSWPTDGFSVRDLEPGASATHTIITACTNVWADVQAYTNPAVIGTRFFSTVAGPIFCGGSGDVYLYVPTGKRPNDANDGSDCANSCRTCGGMPVWSVSEPYLSLWLHDEPLSYKPSIGPRISFQLAFKQRESSAGLDTNTFSVGKKWNFSWLSYVANDSVSNNVVHLPGGREITFFGTNDYLTNTRLTGNTTEGFTLSYPDGSKDVFGFVVTNNAGAFLKAFVSERRNANSQKSLFHYSVSGGSSPVIRLQSVVDGDGRSNAIYYVSANGYSSNLIGSVVDPFGRAISLGYDHQGHLTNILDVAGIPGSFTYDTNDWVSTLSTPYGVTRFDLADDSPNYRSVLVTVPDGGRHLYRYENGVPGLASSYATNQVPVTAPFTNRFDNSQLNQRNSFYWGPRQYAALSTTNLLLLTASDYRKARMKHWLRPGTNWVGETVSLQRDPSPDSAGLVEGQKTWYDYAGKTNAACEGTQVLPQLVAIVLPDGSTRFNRWTRNSFGAVTSEISTYSTTAGGAVLLRTNTLAYDANGIDLLRITNALGIQTAANSYNAHHQVLTNLDALNEMTVFTYDQNQRLTSSTTPAGLVTTNLYGNDGFLARQVVLGFATNSYTYTNGLVHTHTDERGTSTTNVYDALQRITQTSDTRGTVTYEYANLDLVRVVDRMGFVNSFGYDPLRRKIAETNANGSYTLYYYCACDGLDSIRDAAGHSTLFNYDNQGRLITTVYADGFSVTNTYNLPGQLVQTVDSGGVSLTHWFNNQGLMTAMSNALGRVQSVAYDPLDRATNTVDANGASVITGYDELDRVRSRAYPDGGVETFGYTRNFSNPTSYTNQLGQVTRFAYDTENRQAEEINARGESTRFTYDSAGALLTLTDGLNHTTAWRYDAFGRVTNKMDHHGSNLLSYAYDPNGRVISRSSAARGTTFYRYDPIGNLTNIAYPVSPAISLAYDALNRLTNMIDAVGATRFIYDDIGQLLVEDGPWPGDTVTCAHTNRRRASLNLTIPYTPTWNQQYVYDGIGRLTNITSPAGAFGYRYHDGAAVSPATLVSGLSLPSGACITNTYDSNARLLSTRLKNGAGMVLNSHSYSYNQASQRTQQVFSVGNRMDYEYDPIGQLSAARGREPGGTISRLHEQFGYGYDAAHNLISRTNNALVQSFNVNALNELTAVTRSGTLTVAGRTTGDATNVTVNAANTCVYLDHAFASINHAVASGNHTFIATAKDSFGRNDTNSITVSLPATNNYSYDLNGNLLSDGRLGFDFDDENQLIRITATNSWKSEFTYDGRMRRRIARDYRWTGSSWLLTNEVRFVYDGNVIVQHRNKFNYPALILTRGIDLSGSLQHAGGIGGLLALTENLVNHSYCHSDGNGNVTCLINSSQLVVASYQYDPFGRALSVNGPKAGSNPYRFSTKPIHEPSGMYDFLLRWYAPDIQRWLTQDPLGEIGGLNLYTFVHNSPVDHFDPDGRRFFGQNILLGAAARLGVYVVQRFNNAACSRLGRDCSRCCKLTAVALGATCASVGTAGAIATAGLFAGIPVVGWFISPIAGIAAGGFLTAECGRDVSIGLWQCLRACPCK